MRRMRSVWVVLPVSAVMIGGVGWFYAHRAKKAPVETAQAVKPGQVKKTRTPAAAPDSKVVAKNDGRADDEEVHEVQPEVKKGLPAHPVLAALAPEAPGVCAGTEFAGEGPAYTRVTKQSWAAVMEVYHQSKRELLGWLEDQKETLDPKVYARLEKQVRELRIQRPPTPEEPDLAWRGIGVLSSDPDGTPMVRIGGGLVRLVQQDARRARFEMTRLVAQAWAPCELSKLSLSPELWSPLVQCLGLNGGAAAGCAELGYSEAGWAVSTTLAWKLAEPQCSQSVFSAGQPGAGCLKGEIAKGWLVASAQRHPASAGQGRDPHAGEVHQ